MYESRRSRLQRLVRVTRILYQQEAAELARKKREAIEAGETAAAAELRLDAPLEGGDFLSQLSVVRAARARQESVAADTRLHAQLDATMDAMSKKKGAESEQEVHASERQKSLASRDADEVLERVVRPQKSSLG
jgi:hypothetical protein